MESEEIFSLARNGDRRGVKKILENNPDLLNAVDTLAVMLIEKDANINIQDQNLRTALHYACAFGRLDVATLLANKGADLDVQEKNGWSPFHLACDTGSLDVATMLKERGACIDARDSHGYTALHYACAYSRPEMALILVQLGVDVNALENEGRTPLELATDEALIGSLTDALDIQLPVGAGDAELDPQLQATELRISKDGDVYSTPQRKQKDAFLSPKRDPVVSSGKGKTSEKDTLGYPRLRIGPDAPPPMLRLNSEKQIPPSQSEPGPHSFPAASPLPSSGHILADIDPDGSFQGQGGGFDRRASCAEAATATPSTPPPPLPMDRPKSQPRVKNLALPMYPPSNAPNSPAPNSQTTPTPAPNPAPTPAPAPASFSVPSSRQQQQQRESAAKSGTGSTGGSSIGAGPRKYSSRYSSFDSEGDDSEQTYEMSLTDNRDSRDKPPGADNIVLISRFEVDRVTQRFRNEISESSPFQSLARRDSIGASASFTGTVSAKGVTGGSSSSSIYSGALHGVPVLVRKYHAALGGLGSCDSLAGGMSLQLQRLLRELHVLSCCRHENLLGALAACLEPALPCIVYPICDGGSLQDLLGWRPARSKFSASIRLRIAVGVCSALAFLHTPDESIGKPWVVVHRNVRPSKVLLSGPEGAHAHLSGLDLSSVVSDEADSGSISSFEPEACASRDGLTSLICGSSVGFMDPLFNETGEINVSSDVYSFGVLLLQLLTGAASTTDMSQRPPGLVARARNQAKHDLAVGEEGVWERGAEKELISVILRSLSLSLSERPADCSVLLKLLKPLLPLHASSESSK